MNLFIVLIRQYKLQQKTHGLARDYTGEKTGY